MKEFTKEKWKECLVRRNWEKLANTENIKIMSKDFTELVKESQDECAPVKKIKINTNYTHGLTEETKKLIKRERQTKNQHEEIPQQKENNA